MRIKYMPKQYFDQIKVEAWRSLRLVRVNGQFKTVNRDAIPAGANELVTVFRNGKLMVEYTLAEVREMALGTVGARAA